MDNKKTGTLQIECPGCGWTRSFPAEKLSKIRGKKIRCPECYQVSQITERTELQELSSNDGKGWAIASLIFCGGIIGCMYLIYAIPAAKVEPIQKKADKVREEIAKWEDRKKDALESKLEAKKRLREIKEKLKQKKEKLEKLE